MNKSFHTPHQPFNSPFSLFKEKRLVHAVAPAAGPGGWAEVGQHATTFVKKGVLRPANAVYKAMGGSVVNKVAKTTYGTVAGVGDAFQWMSDKLDDGTSYTMTLGKEVFKGFFQSTVGAGYELGVSPLRDAKMNIWDVGKESAKTYVHMGIAPWRFGEEVVQSAVGLIKKPLEIAKKLWHLDIKGVATETRGLISDLFAPLHRPITPILGGVSKTIGKGVESKTQYWNSLKAAGADVRDGLKHTFMDAHGLAVQSMAANQAVRLEARRAEIETLLKEKQAEAEGKKASK